MDTTGLVIELLKQKAVITPLEQDILDTYHELTKKFFDMDSACHQVLKNDTNHPDICAQIAVLPTTTTKSWNAITKEDIIYNLNHQLGLLIEKERRALGNG